MKQFQFLTKGEEQIMLRLWKIEKGSVSDVLEQFEEPKPAYNTISTLIRILEKKKFIKHKKKSRGYLYIPVIQADEYRSELLNHLLQNYYDGNRSELISDINSQNTLLDLL